MWNITKKLNFEEAYLVVKDKFDNEYIFEPILSNKTSLCISNLVPNSNYSIIVLVTFDCVNMTKPVIESMDFMTLPADTSDGSSLTQDCTEYGIPQQNSK